MKRNMNLALFLLCASFLLGGCAEAELAPLTDKNVMSEPDGANDPQGALGETAKFQDNVLTMTLDVPNEEFQLVTSFDTGAYPVEAWRTTDVKYLNLSAKTTGLPEGTKVYIDNIHIDSVIKSLYAAYDSIPIDTMDDRTHTSLFPGFPVSDHTPYQGVFAVGGYSETLISGYTYGYNSFHGASISEKRVTEQDLRSGYVYGNLFQVVWDLWIQTSDEEVPHMTSVISEFLIPTDFYLSGETSSVLIRYNGRAFHGMDKDGHSCEYAYIKGKFTLK